MFLPFIENASFSDKIFHHNFIIIRKKCQYFIFISHAADRDAMGNIRIAIQTEQRDAALD